MSLLCEQFLIYKTFYQKLTMPSLPLPQLWWVSTAQLSDLSLAPASSQMGGILMG